MSVWAGVQRGRTEHYASGRRQVGPLGRPVGGDGRMAHRFSASRALLATLTASAGIVGVVTPSEARPPAHAGGPGGRQSVIVVLNDTVANPGAVAAQQAADYGGSVDQVFRNGLKGWSGHLDPEGVRRAGRDPRVLFVEPDQVFSVDAVQTSGVPWGVDRVDQPSRPSSTGRSSTPTPGPGSPPTSSTRASAPVTRNSAAGHGRASTSTATAAATATGTAPTWPARSGAAPTGSPRRCPWSLCGSSTATAAVGPPRSWPASTGSSRTSRRAPAVANLSFGGSTQQRRRLGRQAGDRRRRDAVVSAGNQNSDACKARRPG